jgi:uncharacterized protein
MAENYDTTTGPTVGPPEHEFVPNSNERMWAAISHLSGFLGYVGIVPFASIIGPLVVWLLKKDESAFIDEHGKESLNFQITMSIAYAISLALWLVLIGIFLTGVLGIWITVLIVVATVKANNGEHFRYPLTLRLVR